MKQNDTVLAIRDAHDKDGNPIEIWEEAKIIGKWSTNLIGWGPDSGFTVQFKDGHTLQHSSIYKAVKPINQSKKGK